MIVAGLLFGWGYGYFQHDFFLRYSIENPIAWEAPFYISGTIGLVWVVLWFSLTGSYWCSANPRNNHCISQAELDLLKRGLQGIDQNVGEIYVLSYKYT